MLCREMDDNLSCYFVAKTNWFMVHKSYHIKLYMHLKHFTACQLKGLQKNKKIRDHFGSVWVLSSQFFF